MNLGPLGLFLVAVVDSSIVPLPIPGSTDLLLLLLVSHQGNPLIFATAAIAGSILGGYTTWHLGRRGGDAALHRWVSARLRARIVAWVEQHPILAVFLPAILPPPIPLAPFVLASGALGVSCPRFLTVFAFARSLRYGLIAWLAVIYGRHVVRLWNALLQKWSTPLLWAFGAILVVTLATAVWKLRRPAKKVHAAKSGVQPTQKKAS
jgi:membrane protein YqaA with SNARE-associated domain